MTMVIAGNFRIPKLERLNYFRDSEVEVHTVYQRLFKKLAKAYTPCNLFFMLYFASFVYWLQAWRFLSKS